MALFTQALWVAWSSILGFLASIMSCSMIHDNFGCIECEGTIWIVSITTIIFAIGGLILLGKLQKAT
jgi:hypothetical protein